MVLDRLFFKVRREKNHQCMALSNVGQFQIGRTDGAQQFSNVSVLVLVK